MKSIVQIKAEYLAPLIQLEYLFPERGFAESGVLPYEDGGSIDW